MFEGDKLKLQTIAHLIVNIVLCLAGRILSEI